MTNTHTAELLVCPEAAAFPGSGNWAEDFERALPVKVEATDAARSLAVAFILAGSLSLPAALDSASWERSRQTSSVFGLSSEMQRRSISLVEARAIAIEILRQAEDERLRAAEEEARGGIDWREVG